MLPPTVWPLLFVRMNRARTADRFRYLGEVQGPDSHGVTVLQSSCWWRLLQGFPAWGVVSHRCLTVSLSCSFRLGRHVFGNRARTKVPGHATSRFGPAMGAMDLLLHYSSNAEIAGYLEGSNTAKQSSSGTKCLEGGVVSDRQQG